MYPQDDKNCKCSRHTNYIEDKNISLKMCKTCSILSSVTIVLTGHVQANEAFIKLRFFFRYPVNILFQSDEQFCILGKWTKNILKNSFDHLGLSVSCSWTIFSQQSNFEERQNNLWQCFCMTRRDFYRHRKYSILTFCLFVLYRNYYWEIPSQYILYPFSFYNRNANLFTN